MADYTNFDEANAALDNPATSAADLQTIAQYQPSLYAKIAAHPAAYDGLLDWLASSGDPAVIAAVNNRRAQPTPAAVEVTAEDSAPIPADADSGLPRHSGAVEQNRESGTESDEPSLEIPTEPSEPIPADVDSGLSRHSGAVEQDRESGTESDEPSLEIPTEPSEPIPADVDSGLPRHSGAVEQNPESRTQSDATSIEAPAETSAPIPTEPSIPVPVEPTSPVSTPRIDPMGHPAPENSGPVPAYAPAYQSPDGQPYPAPDGAQVMAVPPVPPKAPKPPSPFLTDSLSALKAVASLDPATAVVGAAEHKSPTGWAFGGIFALVSGLAGIALVRQVLSTVLGAFMGSMSGFGIEAVDAVFPWWRVFLSGLALGILSFLIWVGGAQLYRIFAKAKASFAKTVNVVGTALIPATAALIVGALVGIAWAPIGALVIIVGFFASAMLIFSGLNKVMNKPEGLVWPFVGIFAMVLALSALAALFVFNLFG
jgi:hypothetical protein